MAASRRKSAGTPLKASSTTATPTTTTTTRAAATGNEHRSFMDGASSKRLIFAVVFTLFVLTAMRFVVDSAQGASFSSSSAPQKYQCAADNNNTPLQMAESRGVTVLVTGAAGFIGSHVARYAAESLGMNVVAVDDMSGGFFSNIDVNHERITFVQGDLKDDEFVERLFQEHGPFVYVYHLAAYAAEGMSHFIRKFNYRNNLVTSVALLNEAIRSDVECFVFTSSIAAYGPAQTPMIETTIPEPEDAYGIAKYAFELDLKSAHHIFGIDYIIFRPHNVYGPGQNIYDRYRNVIGIFMQQLLSGKPMTIFGDGEQTRAFSYIDDVAPVIAMAPLVAAARNQVFNVGADQPYTLNELAVEVNEAMKPVMKAVNAESSAAAAAADAPINIQYLDARKEVLHAESDHSKVNCIFHRNTTTTLHTGIKLMAEWVALTGKSFAPTELSTEVELLREMPASWVTEAMKKNEQRKRDKLAKKK